MQTCLQQVSEPHAELMHTNALQYRFDDGSMLENPLGLYGSKIEAEVLGIYVSHNQLKPFVKLCNQCGCKSRR